MQSGRTESSSCRMCRTPSCWSCCRKHRSCCTPYACCSEPAVW
jgi:hypothetical protein